MTWPLALALARLFAQSRIFYVTQSQKGVLAERVLRIESANAEAGWHGLFGDSPELPERQAKQLENTHTVVSFVASSEDRWSANVRRLAPEANLSCINSIVPPNFSGHVIEWMIGQWRSWPAAHAAAQQIVHSLGTRGLSLTAHAAAGPILLHPGAGAQTKCWPADRYQALAQRLSDAGRAVYVVLGEVELERWPAAQIAAFERICPVLRPTTYVELLDHLAAAAVFVGNDSGPGHLAGMLGIPTLSLFAATDPARWKPLGPRVQVLNGAADGLGIDAVFDAVKAMRV